MLNLALIGNGKWGQNYVKTVKAMDNCHIKYIKNFDYLDLLEYDDIDGIIIATPDSTHIEVAKHFPKTPLLIEKPVVMSLYTLHVLKDYKIMAGHIYIYNLDILKNIQETEPITRLYFDLMNDESVAGTTPLWHLHTHTVALCIFTFGIPKKIYAFDNNGTIEIILKYDDVTCTLRAGFNNRVKQRLLMGIGKESSFLYDGLSPLIAPPLHVEISAFLKFIQDGQTLTGMDHIIDVTKVLVEVEQLLENGS